jgi:hypothetical protein
MVSFNVWHVQDWDRVHTYYHIRKALFPCYLLFLCYLSFFCVHLTLHLAGQVRKKLCFFVFFLFLHLSSWVLCLTGKVCFVLLFSKSSTYGYPLSLFGGRGWALFSNNNHNLILLYLGTQCNSSYSMKVILGLHQHSKDDLCLIVNLLNKLGN